MPNTQRSYFKVYVYEKGGTDPIIVYKIEADGASDAEGQAEEDATVEFGGGEYEAKAEGLDYP